MVVLPGQKPVLEAPQGRSSVRAGTAAVLSLGLNARLITYKIRIHPEVFQRTGSSKVGLFGSWRHEFNGFFGNALKKIDTEVLDTI